MKKALTRISNEVYYYKDGERVEGIHVLITGDITGIWGDVSGIEGDVYGITGNVTDCEITDTERANGINIANLVS